MQLYPQNINDVRTLRDAVDFLNDRFATQIERAEDEKVEPNKPVRGDGEVRAAFWTLLPPPNQRTFFLKLLGDRRCWPRLRTLVGSPPFTFLLPEDEGVLRAAGITPSRVKMAHSEATTSNYGDFGRGHFEDAAQRLWRIVGKERNSDHLPFDGLVKGMRVVADVRVLKRTKDTKLQILKGQRGSVLVHTLVFPRAGDAILLRKVASLRRAQDDDEPIRVRVEGGRQKAANSPVARLVLKIE